MIEQQLIPLYDLFADQAPEYEDLLPPDLPDPMDFIEARDLVELNLPGAVHSYYGQISRINVEVQQALVDCNDGARRWASIGELTLILKSSALEQETPTSELISVS